MNISRQLQTTALLVATEKVDKVRSGTGVQGRQAVSQYCSACSIEHHEATETIKSKSSLCADHHYQHLLRKSISSGGGISYDGRAAPLGQVAGSLSSDGNSIAASVHCCRANTGATREWCDVVGLVVMVVPTGRQLPGVLYSQCSFRTVPTALSDLVTVQ